MFSLIETEMNRKVRKIISLLAVCCIIMLSSCGKQANHRTVQVDDRTIRFGATEDDILKVLGTPDSEEDYAENEKNLRYDKPVITNFGKVESITFCFSACNYYDNEEIPLRLISVKVYLESEKDKMEELLTEYYGKFDEVSKVRSISDNMNSISNESITGTEYEAYVYGWESNSFGELSKKEQSEFADVYSAHLGEQGIIEWVTNTERQRTEITINYSTTDGKCVVLMDDTLGYLIDQMRENK